MCRCSRRAVRHWRLPHRGARHRSSGRIDSLLLAGGCLAIALVPWCVAVWYMFSRLRLAVELDCDARVLRAGAAPQSYGSLLIDVAEQVSDFRIGATALVAGPSHLQRRLM